MNTASGFTLLALVLVVPAGACSRDTAERVLAPSAERAAKPVAEPGEGHIEGLDDGGPRFSDWATPINLGAGVNSPSEELTPSVSRDGLSIYFGSPQPDFGVAVADIFISHRASRTSAWGPATNLGAVVNIAGEVTENAPMVSVDGHRLFLHSNRPSGFGGQDVYVSRRRGNQSDTGWEAPMNLGSMVNTSANETGPEYVEDEESGSTTLYFASNRPGGLGGNDIYASVLLPDGTFGPAALVPELSSPLDDQSATVRRDGLELFLASNRVGTHGAMDLWVSSRATTSDPWSAPVNLGPGINTVNIEAGPGLSFDGATLYFHSANRPGNIGGPRFDIWMTTRTRLTGQPER